MKTKHTLALMLAAGALLVSGSALAATFKVAVGDAQGGSQWELATSFKQALEARTGGKYTVDLFPNGQLGSEQTTVNSASMGTLDMSILAVNNITPFSPTVGVLTLPYVILSPKDAKTVVMGEVGKELAANTLRDAGVRILGWAFSGFRVLTNSNRPVKTLADLQGLKIRVPKNEIMIASYQSWGINPTPMAWSETFTALQQRVVDGQDNPYVTVHAMKFNEVQKYITNLRYVFSLEPLIVSESVFQKQPADVQQAILDAGAQATQHSYDWLLAKEDSIKKDLVAKGMQITNLTDEDQWMAKATKAVWPKFYSSIGGKAKLDHVLSLLGR